MSLRDQAWSWADALLRSVLADAIQYRREHPLRFALFHVRMLEIGTRARRWHAFWAQHYAAKAWALDAELARRCTQRLAELDRLRSGSSV